MRKALNVVMLLALSVGMLGATAAAQESRQVNLRIQYASFDGVQGGQFLLVDSDDHRRCDGDHDRDDRGCWERDRNGNWYYRGNGYRSNGYYSNGYYGNGYNQNSGWYDRKGNFYPNGANGYYDKHGKWHYYAWRRGHDRDDR